MFRTWGPISSTSIGVALRCVSAMPPPCSAAPAAAAPVLPVPAPAAGASPAAREAATAASFVSAAIWDSSFNLERAAPTQRHVCNLGR